MQAEDIESRATLSLAPHFNCFETCELNTAQQRAPIL